MYYWIFMIIAILAEVTGTLSMKYGMTHASPIGIKFMYIMIILSYSSLCIAVKHIPLAIAYGAWESLGMVLIALFSTLFFAEPLGAAKISGILLIIIGMLMLNKSIYSFRQQP
jgi:spermidine export protein MdtJ